MRLTRCQKSPHCIPEYGILTQVTVLVNRRGTFDEWSRIPNLVVAHPEADGVGEDRTPPCVWSRGADHDVVILRNICTRSRLTVAVLFVCFVNRTIEAGFPCPLVVQVLSQGVADALTPLVVGPLLNVPMSTGLHTYTADQETRGRISILWSIQTLEWDACPTVATQYVP